MNIRIAGTVNDSIVDGNGLRYTIFVQGCPHHCKGCHNPQTHSFDGGKEVSISDLFETITSNTLLDGVTFSGGEPFAQAKPLVELADLVKQNTNLNIVTYTGYTFEEIVTSNNPDWIALLNSTDILIDGKFIEDLKSYELRFRGSSNQRYIDVKQSLLQHKVVLADI
jgi:anaerobic ribonucleoside-triphosphate reductase activating protein|nr:MAG TPA: anaerobic ribonucleoside-triphosphate reductase activating protein [Caudoviricetes sp.]